MVSTLDPVVFQDQSLDHAVFVCCNRLAWYPVNVSVDAARSLPTAAGTVSGIFWREQEEVYLDYKQAVVGAGCVCS